MDEFIIKPNITENTILVVDDSNITRNLIEKVYDGQYKVLMASNGREAIDLNMPDLDGFAVLDYFKEKGLFSKIPVSIITGDSSKPTIDRVMTYNVVDVLIKPFSAFDIEKTVSKMVK